MHVCYVELFLCMCALYSVTNRCPCLFSESVTPLGNLKQAVYLGNLKQAVYLGNLKQAVGNLKQTRLPQSLPGQPQLAVGMQLRCTLESDRRATVCLTYMYAMSSCFCVCALYIV